MARLGLLAGLVVSLLAGLVVSLVAVPLALALAPATPAVGHRLGAVNGLPPPRFASSAATARSETLAPPTGLGASRVSSTPVCPPVGPGVARCAAQVLVRASDHQLVRPHISPRTSFTQVFPRGAQGIAPSTAPTVLSAPPAGTPAYLQQAYDLTYLSQTTGANDTVAIVDAYDDPNAAADLGRFRSTYGLPVCGTGNGCFAKVNQQGSSSPLPAGDPGWEMEMSLDLDAVSALCPNCRILLVEANTPSVIDMDRAVVTADGMGADQISASWAIDSGAPVSGTYTFAGVAVVAATGDGGYLGTEADAYPAAFPGVTAAGATTLTESTSAAASSRGWSESAWSVNSGWGGGSGCDLQEPKPSYQDDAGCAGRSYADVSADGDPGTGLGVYDSDNGGWVLVGGTSLATPLIAAYDAITGVAGASPRWAYSDRALLNDPSVGSTGSCALAITYICDAGSGYDGPSGAGSISGAVVDGAPGVGGPGVGTGINNSYAQSLSATGATLTGGVYANGLSTTFRWQYGTTTAYPQQTPVSDAGAGHRPAAVTSYLTGLTPSTTYHYRLVAQNSVGTSYGYDYTLATPAAAPPVNTQAPLLSGTGRPGQTLTVSSGSWNPAATTYAYLWQRSTTGAGGWVDLAGASATSYSPTAADVGETLRVVVAATNLDGTQTAGSNVVGPVLSGAPSAIGRPVITGAARQGQRMSTTGGSWSAGASGHTYVQWQRSTTGASTWTNLTGANGTTYTPTGADVGARIDVVVSAINLYATTRSVSLATGPVAARGPASIARPSISDRAPRASASSASAVMSVGERILRNSRGTALATADVSSLALPGAGASGVANPAPARIVVLRRVRGATGRLRAWVCPAARAARRCTAQFWLRSVLTFAVRGSERGRLRIALVRSSRTTPEVSRRTASRTG